ncbi:MAG: UDP-glucose/GDP-mannose dehydrogenase family protein [Calditrichaeota bacterium]|nr:UDP-glucose/GDP-mannose dehydrogenase family protein [Calditrichota bacterium]MCB9368631.1 UDP-glucose/GDP-mannose dehydrogenase family protein [Calditrichota bacterium]
MKVTVIGTGYVGLVTGTCLAESGNTVACVDTDPRKIEMLKKGVVPIYEPGLKEYLDRNVAQGRLSFTTDLYSVMDDSEVLMIAVGTPPGEDGSADLSYVLAVAESIGKRLKSYKVIVNKSTVPVGSGDLVRETIAKHTNVEFDVVSNPEFLKEGDAVNDFMKPDRIVIGVSSQRAEEIMKRLYAPFHRTGYRVVTMDVRSAEMTKYAANAMLATKITFMNEIANLCEECGADINHVRFGIGSDKRIGPHFLFAGIGYGGSCFPKDVSALIKIGKKYGQEMKILDAVDEVNHKQRTRLVEKVVKHFGEDLTGLKLGIWGLAFKPRTDDMREAPSIYMIEMLHERGAKLHVYDPQSMENARPILGDKVHFYDDYYSLLKDADALLIATEWQEFREPDFARVKSQMKRPVIFDGRNLFEPSHMSEMGFEYFGIGRN